MIPQRFIFGKIPVLRYAVCFIVGILVAGLSGSNIPSVYLLILPVGFGIVILLRNKSNKNYFQLYTTFILLLFALCGLFYSSCFSRQQFDEKLPLQALYKGKITDQLSSMNRYYRYNVRLVNAATADSVFCLHEKILLYYIPQNQDSLPEPGNLVAFSAKLYPIENKGNPGEFNYKRFMKKRGIRYRTFVKTEIKILPGNGYTLKSLALQVRNKLLRKYREAGIKGNSFAVLAALTLGEKKYLGTETKNAFASSGAMHVLAVSGLHVGIIYVIFNILLFKLNHKKLLALKILLITGLLWGYAFITGLSPSVMRACTMFSLVAIGENINRKTNTYNTLALSALILSLINPNVIYETGFQLSYSAVTSIIFFQPQIAGLLKLHNKILKYLWELLAVSVAAQIGTFPISVYYFHQFPVYFWLSSFIVIPAATFLLYGAFLFFVTHFIPYLPSIIATVLDYTIRIMNFGIEGIEKLPGSVIKNLWMDKLTMVILFLIIIAIGALSIKKQFKYLAAFFLVCLLLATNSIYQNVKTNRQQLIIFYNTSNNGLVSIIDAKNHFYYSTQSPPDNYSKNLLKNASGIFHAHRAVPIDSASFYSNNIRFFDNFLLFKQHSILINAGRYEKSNSLDMPDLKFTPDDSKISVKKNEKMNLRILKKGNLVNFVPLNNDRAVSTRQKALLVFF